MDRAVTNPLVIEANSPGFMQEQIDKRLRDNGFAPQWREITAPDNKPGNKKPGDKKPVRRLIFPDRLSDQVLAGEQVVARYDTAASSISRDYEALRITRSLYTVLADITVVSAQADGLSAQTLAAFNLRPRIWQLEVKPAGQRKNIPSGFQQAIPGILVMFTLLILLTSGASMLALERISGLLRRLASAPISRVELIAGKWGGRMVLAVLQIGTAMAIGTLFFRMDWGPDFAMVLVVLAAWAAFCASAGLLLGSVARTEAQAAGLGVLLANLLAALGGCWWPIEITPPWMQFLQKLLPTGWAMDALHKLISFESGALSALPHVAALIAGTVVVAWLAVKQFRYQ